eukprot:gene12695-14668_t
MNDPFVIHSSKSYPQVLKSTSSAVEPSKAVSALYILSSILCKGGALILSLSASVDTNKQLKALSTLLDTDLALCCYILLDFAQLDAFTWGLQYVKTILLKANNEGSMRYAASLVLQMIDAGKEDQTTQLKRFQSIICTKGAAHKALVETVLLSQFRRLPLLLSTNGASLVVSLPSQHQTSVPFAEMCSLLQNKSSQVEFRELLRAAQSVVEKCKGENQAEVGDCIATIVSAMHDLLCTCHVEQTRTDLIGSVVTVCEEEWVNQQLNASSILKTPEAAITRTLLHLHLVTTLLEKQHISHAAVLPTKAMIYLSFLFDKLFMFQALQESSQYFAYLSIADPRIGHDVSQANKNNTNEFAVATVVRLLSHLASEEQVTSMVSICAALLASSTLQDRSTDRSLPSNSQDMTSVPNVIVYESIKKLVGPCPALRLYISNRHLLERPEKLFLAVALSAGLNSALQKDLREMTLGSLNERVGLVQCVNSLNVIEAMQDWVQIDSHAALSLVLDTVSHVLHRHGETESPSLSLLAVIGVLSQFAIDVATHFQVNTTALLRICTAAPLSHPVGRSKDCEKSNQPDESINNMGVTLDQRIVLDEHSFLRSAVFLTSLCAAHSSAHIEELEQWLVETFTKKPVSALLLLNDFTFLGPLLSCFSDAVVTERVTSCLHILSKKSSLLGSDNLYLLDAFATLPTFLTMSRHSQYFPKVQQTLEQADPTETNGGACSYDEIEKLEQQVLQEPNVSRLINTTAFNFNVRLQALNRTAILSDDSRYAHSRGVARSYLANKSDLFLALVGTAQASTPSFQQIVRCELFLTSQERSLCQRPARGADLQSMPVISAAKLEFLLSQYCAELKAACASHTPPAFPWFNLNDLTFSVLHALRTTVRPIPCSTSHADPALWLARSFEVDASVVAVAHDSARFISLPVVVTVLRESLLRLLDLPSLGTNHQLPEQQSKDAQCTVLLQYVCAALSLLECPHIPRRQAAQVLCGAFTTDLLTKLWHRFVFDTVTFSDTLLCTLDRAVALLVSKGSGQSIAAEGTAQEKPEGELEVLALCAPVLCLCDTVARHGVERHGYSMPENSVYRRLQVNCAHLLSCILEPSLFGEGQSRSGSEYKQPISVVGALTSSSKKLLLFAPTGRFNLSRGQHSRTDASAEVNLNVARKDMQLLESARPIRLQLSLADLLKVLLCCKGDKTSAPVLSDAEFDTLVTKNVIKAAQRGSASEGWQTQDFNFVQLLEDCLDHEFNGNHKDFTATVLRELLHWSGFQSLVQPGTSSSPYIVRALTILLQTLRSKSAKISFAGADAKESDTLLRLVVRSLSCASNSSCGDYYISIGRVNRHAEVDFEGLQATSDARLRQVTRWILATTCFVDLDCALQEALQRCQAARASDTSDALFSSAVAQLQLLVSLYAHCAQVKEKVPIHVCNWAILVLGVVTAELLLTPGINEILIDGNEIKIKTNTADKVTAVGSKGNKKQKKDDVVQRLRTSFLSVLKHLLVTAQPGQPELLTQCQGLFLKHSIPRSTEVCGLLKKILASDADLQALHTQVTHHSQAHQQHPHGYSSPRGAPTSSSALSKRPASTQNLDINSPAGENSVNPTATKKMRKERPIASESTPPVLSSAPSLSRHTDKKIKQEGFAQANSTPEGHVTYRTFDTSHSVAPSTSSALSNVASSSVSRIRANNSFLSAIMEVPTASPVPPELPPQLSQSDAVLSPSATTPLQNSAHLEFTPASTKRNLAVSENSRGDTSGEVQVKSESASQSSKPVVVTHVSRKFGGGF